MVTPRGNTPIAPTHKMVPSTKATHRSKHNYHRQKHSGQQKLFSRPPSSYNPTPDVVISSRLPLQPDPDNTFGSSVMLQTPPRSLEPGHQALVSPIVSETMTYYSITSPAGEDEDNDEGTAKQDGRTTIQLIVNTKLGEDVINLNEVTDSEYESSAVWVTRRCGQSSEDKKQPKKNTFSKRFLGHRCSTEAVSGSFQETKKSKTMSSKSKRGPGGESRKQQPKYASPRHASATPAPALKMKNALQEVWKEARRKAFDRTSFSNTNPTQPPTSSSANISSGDNCLVAPDIESHI